MSGVLDLEVTANRILTCPHCGATMNTSEACCPSCSTPIDRESASEAADQLAIVDQAISDASTVKYTVGSIFGGLAIGLFISFRSGLAFMPVQVGRLEPPLAFLSLIAFGLGVVLCIPLAMAIRWWSAFAQLNSPDPEFPGAKHSVLVFGAIALASILLAAAIAVVTFI